MPSLGITRCYHTCFLFMFTLRLCWVSKYNCKVKEKKRMDFPIKREAEEATEHFILSTIENESMTGSTHPEHTKKEGKFVSNGFIRTEMKQEPINNYGDNSECEDEYLDEESETETSQPHNSKSRSGKKGQARTSQAQIQKLADFMNNKGKQPDSDKALHILTEELNKIGPPIRTSAQWRRTWSILKYNNKRKRQAGLYTGDRSKLFRLDHNDDADATNSTSSKTHDNNEEDIPITNDHFQSQVLKTMTLMLGQQAKQTSQLEKLNKNLENLIHVLTRKYVESKHLK